MGADGDVRRYDRARGDVCPGRDDNRLPDDCGRMAKDGSVPTTAVDRFVEMKPVFGRPHPDQILGLYLAKQFDGAQDLGTKALSPVREALPIGEKPADLPGRCLSIDRPDGFEHFPTVTTHT